MELSEAKKECKELIEEYLSCSVIGLDMQVDVSFGEKRCEAIDTVLKELEIEEQNYKVLCEDLTDALKELGLPEDTIISDELADFIREKYVSKDEIRKKMDNEGKLFIETRDVRYANRRKILKELLGEE